MNNVETQMEGIQLKNFHQLASSAVQLGPKTFAAVRDDELFELLNLMESENIPFPPRFEGEALQQKSAEVVG